MSEKWMIYGANGYTGRLIAELAVKTGLTPVLAGRDREALKTLASKLDLEYRVFTLDQEQALLQGLKEIQVVLNCAGPFHVTAEKILKACRQTRTHYCDITGESSVFQMVHAAHDLNAQAGIVACPGVGFDVVPTDCLAFALKEALPSATELSLGFQTDLKPSRGTLLTVLGDLGKGTLVRRGGSLLRVPFGTVQRVVTFGEQPVNAVSIPWGDVVTAFYATQIPDITVYVPMHEGKAKFIAWLDKQAGFLKKIGVTRLLEAYVKRRVNGPTLQAREENPAFMWGEARDSQGNCVIGRFKTPNPYSFTLCSALVAVRFLLEYMGKGGSFTPSMLMGTECLEEIPGVTKLVLKRIEGLAPHLQR